MRWGTENTQSVCCCSATHQKSRPTPDLKCMEVLPACKFNRCDAQPIIYFCNTVNVSPQPLSSLLSVQSIAPSHTLLSSIHWPELHMYCCGAQVGSWVTHKLSSSSEPSKQSLCPSQVLDLGMQAPFPQVNWEVLQVS